MCVCVGMGVGVDMEEMCMRWVCDRKEQSGCIEVCVGVKEIRVCRKVLCLNKFFSCYKL